MSASPGKAGTWSAMDWNRTGSIAICPTWQISLPRRAARVKGRGGRKEGGLNERELHGKNNRILGRDAGDRPVALAGGQDGKPEQGTGAFLHRLHVQRRAGKYLRS